MNCIILGDKYAKGMKSKGCSALLSYNKKINILQHQINFIKKFLPESNIIYVYGYCSDDFSKFVKDKNIDIHKIYNDEYEQYGQFNSLSLTKDFMNSECLVFDGYFTLKKSYVKNIKKNSKESFVLVENKNIEGAGCVVSGNTVKNFGYNLPYSTKNLYYFDKTILNFLKEFCLVKKYQNYFIFEILNEILDENISIKPILI